MLAQTINHKFGMSESESFSTILCLCSRAVGLLRDPSGGRHSMPTRLGEMRTPVRPTTSAVVR